MALQNCYLGSLKFEKNQILFFIAKSSVFFTKLKKQKFQKTLTQVFLGVLIGMCTKFQVDTFENHVFIACETSKMATFHDTPMHH